LCTGSLSTRISIVTPPAPGSGLLERERLRLRLRLSLRLRLLEPLGLMLRLMLRLFHSDEPGIEMDWLYTGPAVSPSAAARSCRFIPPSGALHTVEYTNAEYGSLAGSPVLQSCGLAPSHKSLVAWCLAGA
jgi:hypothetical protein